MALHHLPIQRKLVGFIFLTTLVVVLGTNLALFVYESRSSAKATIQSLKTMSDIIAANSTAAMIYDDPKLAQENLSALRAEPNVTAAALFDKSGRIYAVYPADLPRASLPTSIKPDGYRFTIRELVLYREVAQGGNRVGTLYLRSDLVAMYRRLGVYAYVLVGVLVGAAILSYLLSTFLQRQISRPILDLAEAARKVTQDKDYSVRARQYRRGDELGFVTEAFNGMLEQIQLNHAILGESEERFRVVADSAPVLIWILGTDRRATWFNRHWLNFTGRTLEEEVGEGWMDGLHPDDRKAFLEAFTEAFGLREYFRLECRMRRHDGQYRWLLSQGAPRHQGGEFAGFIGSCVDITANKLAEESVRLSEFQLRLVTDHASVFLCQIDTEHRFRYVNRAYASRYGLEPKDVIDRPLSDVLGRGAYEVIRPNLDAAFAGARQDFEAELPYDALGRRWIHAVYEPQKSESGSVVGIVAVLSDVTGRRLAAMELERARDEALGASRAKDDFLAALSHELRTPLSPVLLLATDAAANRDLPQPVRDDFETVRKNIELEARLIDDLLDLTRITKGKMALEQQAVDIHVVIRDAIATIHEDLQAKRIELVMDLAGGRPIVKGDPVRLQQVFWNVLKNAVKFTPLGGRITIVTTLSAKRDAFVTKVSDTGIGILPTDLDVIFDAFAQGEPVEGTGLHRFGGLGLGLAISRKLVELHAGRITAASEGRNKGSTFTVEIPLWVAARAGADSRSGLQGTVGRPAEAPVAVAQGARRAILLVEDHAPTRLALERLLSRRNFRVIAAGTVAEALAAAAKEKFDLVISDIGLPDGNGYDLMAELEETHHLKGIALTGYGVDAEGAKERGSGFVVRLLKPVSIQALDAAIASCAPELAKS
jgi:PAS domain S-box-containing protein